MSASSSVFKIIPFRRYFFSRLFMTFAINMLTTVIFWQVYEITGDSFKVGMMGLVEFLPFVVVTLFGGYLADIIDRKNIISTSIFTYFLCVLYLFFISTHYKFLLENYGILPIFVVNFIIGIVRGFLSPAQSAFSAQLVPKEMLAYSSNWLTMTWHIGSVGGPAVGGIAYAYLGVKYTYILILSLVFLGFLMFQTVPKQPMSVISNRENIFFSLKEGLRFVFRNKIVLGALTLDMLAVLFGGAIAMLPEFADKILNEGAIGLGYLRAAPAIGAILMGIFLTKYPPTKHAGRKLLWSVFGFGAATILFAISTNFYLSFFALALTGLFDNVSMVIRGTIISLYTPNEMRGRVSAVNSIFIGSSNELGAFESGLASRIMGPVPSVFFGGSMTLIIVAFIARYFPTMRDFSLYDEKK